MKTPNIFAQLAILVSLPWLLGGYVGKNEGINWKELNFREAYSIAYLKGSDTLYTGKAVLWHENGNKNYEKTYKDEELISTKFWNSKGEPVDSIREAN